MSRGVLAECRRVTAEQIDAESFWLRVAKTDDCWEWTGPRDKYGYGYIHVGENRTGAHRVALILSTGSDQSLHALHGCNNPACVRPDHLRWGTHKENLADAAAADRMPFGEAHHNAKLTESDVRSIRAAHASGERQVDIAKRHGVSQSNVIAIVTRRSWRRVA